MSTATKVSIVQSKENLWGIAVRRASLLVEVLDKLSEYDESDKVHDTLQFCMVRFDAAHDERKSLDNPSK